MQAGKAELKACLYHAYSEQNSSWAYWDQAFARRDIPLFVLILPLY